MNRPLSVPDVRQSVRYREPIVPIVFPEEEKVPESYLHHQLCSLLFMLLEYYLGDEVAVGANQFVYYVGDDPKQSLAPDVYVRLVAATDMNEVTSWKTWERGAPEVAVEIVDHCDAPELPWQTKLARYQRVGVVELVRFDPKADAGGALRIWDRVDGALVERVVEDDRAPSVVLPLHWVVARAKRFDRALRIASGANGEILVPTSDEREAAAAAARREAEKRREIEAAAREMAETLRAAEFAARQAAEVRIRELEEELRRRSGG